MLKKIMKCILFLSFMFIFILLLNCGNDEIIFKPLKAPGYFSGFIYFSNNDTTPLNTIVYENINLAISENYTLTPDNNGSFYSEIPYKDLGIKTVRIIDIDNDLDYTFEIEIKPGKNSFVLLYAKNENSNWTVSKNIHLSDYKNKETYDLWSKNYFKQMTSLEPTNFWRYKNSNGTNIINANVRKHNYEYPYLMEYYENINIENITNFEKFMVEYLKGSIQPNYDFSLFTPEGEIIGLSYSQSDTKQTVYLDNPIDIKEIYQNLRIGKSQQIEFNIYGTANHQYQILLGFEDIITENDTYLSTAKIITLSHIKDYSLTWYAEDVGLIKSEIYDSEGNISDSFIITNYRIKEPELILPKHQKEWTFMFYGAADDNFRSDLTESILLTEVLGLYNNGSTDYVNFIVQFQPSVYNHDLGVVSGFHGLISNFTAYVKDDKFIHLRNNGLLNVGCPNNLTEFVDYCKTNFPANNYILVFSGHGAGSITGAPPEPSDKNFIISFAESFNDYLTYPNLKKSFMEIKMLLNKKLDLFIVDSCFMATVEFAYELQDYVDYIIASKFATYGNNYSNSLNILKNNPYISILDFSRYFIDETYEYRNSKNQGLTLSLIKPDEINNSIIDSFRNIASSDNQYLTDITIDSNPALFEDYFSYPQIDLFYLMEYFLSADIIANYSDIQYDAENILNSKDNIVLYSRNTEAALEIYYETIEDTVVFSHSGLSVFWGVDEKFTNGINTYKNALTIPRFELDTNWSRIFSKDN